MRSSSRALGLGAISGLRSLAGPALLSRAAVKGHLSLEGTALAFLGSPPISKALLVMVLGELVADKLPVTPSRTALPPLLGRVASGVLVGAAVFASDGRHAAAGAAVGSSAAVAAAFAGERLRARWREDEATGPRRRARGGRRRPARRLTPAEGCPLT